MVKPLHLATSCERLVAVVVAAVLLQSDAQYENSESSSLPESGWPGAECEGFGEEYEACPNLGPCLDCTPRDCSFSDWEDWYNLAGCIGLCFRARSIVDSNNECGKPCVGPKTQSKACPELGCSTAEKDCLFSDWDTWSGCSSDIDQRVRVRLIMQLAGSEGQPCKGAVKETQACSSPEVPVDCLFSEWGPWAACSDLCGGGHRTRVRRVYRHAAHGGKSCLGNTSQLATCNTNLCPGNSDCLLSSWSTWAGCDSFNPMQRYRRRDVKRRATGSGRPCMNSLRETEACPVHVADVHRSCILSQWSQWTQCSETCGGGQMFRSRHPPHGGPSQCFDIENTRETKACNMTACVVPGSRNGTDCEFSSWSTWSECSETCGPGKKERTRTILGEARGQGLACVGAIVEVIGCLGVKAAGCGPVDCVWGDWDVWGACSASCGNGLHHRSRSVAHSPRRGGRLCDPVAKTEVASCATEGCVRCVDGEWSPWSSWSDCSMTCDHGVRSRQRMVAKQPNHCGHSPLGKDAEVQVCTAGGLQGMVPCVPDRDCVFSAWGAWSDCLPECFGVRERNREIEVYSQGNGLPCADKTGEVEPCNPGVGQPVPATCQHIPVPRPCELSSWTVWTLCTESCGGGQSSRERNIIGWPDHNGAACAAHLFETRACNTQRCAPKRCPDCSWGPWCEWSHCTRCGGQRERKRSIEQMPNYCGKRCDTRSAMETSNCSSECSHGQYCTWAPWTAFSDCPNPAEGCGPHTKRRHRHLHYVNTPTVAGYIFEGSGKLQCSGIESVVESCPYRSCIKPCTREECIFGDWSDWGEPGCDGLCERDRVVQQNGACGARPCEGALSETKRCKTTCNMPVDCKLEPWSSWTGCHADNEQTYRVRAIEHPTLHGGKTCSGNLKETLPCSGGEEPMRPCTLTEWSKWSPCHSLCGNSWQVRNRFVHSPASGGGEACENSLKEIQSCSRGPCGIQSLIHDCEFAPWDNWSVCRPDGQKARERTIAHYAKFGGKACRGDMEELHPCDKEDCILGKWTAWAGCTVTCGGGQQQRHRQVDRPARHGGSPCPPSVSLKEIRSCGQAPCSWRDCTVEQWSSWASCSSTCGVGQQTRTRAVNQTRRMDGSGCFFPMVETRQCPVQRNCRAADCVWGSWSSWSTCSVTCGGGQQHRSRNIKVFPQPGGLSCDEASMEEVRPCKLNSCNAGGCVDGEWGSWSSWGHCSASCQGGVSWRWRKVVQQANSCGKRAAGPDRQYKSCNVNVTCHDVDCEFGQWEDWSGCTAPCNGIKRRSRSIQVFGYGAGAHCKGALKETAPCHPSEGSPMPPSCKFGVNQDCKFSEWVEGPCSSTCGGGHVQRTRHIQVDAIGSGKQCSGEIEDYRPCGTQACPHSAPVCHWGDWSSWGACDKCGGERKRNRQLQQVPTGGQACDPGASEDVERCPRTCDDTDAGLLCAWNPWEAWSSCSATCGSGRRQRRRGLVLKAGGSLPDAVMLAEQQQHIRQWELQTQKLEQKRLQDLVVAALVGGCAVAAALATIVLRTRSQSHDLRAITHARDDDINLLPALDISD